MNALNRLKQLLGLPEDAAEETLQAELDKLESLLTPANPAASDPPALPGQPPFPHQADPLPGNARPTLFDFLQACHPQAALTSLVRANTALRDQLSVALSVTQGDRVARNRRNRRALEPWACRLGHRAGTPEPGGAGNLSCRRFAHCRALVVPEHGQPPRAVGSRRVSALR